MVRLRRRVITGEDDAIGSSVNVECENSVPKRKKKQQKDESGHNSDRLSELPDCLLVQILSWLPMKDAVGTGILCKRWKSLWTLVDRIRFCCEARNYDELFRFTSFVDQTLMQPSRPNIEEFSLCMLIKDYIELESLAMEKTMLINHYFEQKNPGMEKWLQYVSSKNVKFLKLDVNVCELPNFAKFSWLSLEKLSLRRLYIGDKQIADILLGCPLLDTLILDQSWGIKHLNIASSKLRKLKVLNKWKYALPFPKINAPWLQELEISGYFYYFYGQVLVDVPSLLSAKVTVTVKVNGNNDERIILDVVTEILRKLDHVEELIVGQLLIQGLSVLKLLGEPSPVFKCKTLTIESPLLKYDLPGIACLLQRSPYLETLIIQLQLVNQFQPTYFSETCNVKGEEYLSMQKGNLQYLKNVRIVDERNLCVCDQSRLSNLKFFDFEVMAYLLKNASVLEKFVITSPRNNSCKCSINCAFQLSHKLIYSCLDGNGAAKCEFRKKQSEYEFIYLARGLDK